MVLKSWKKYKDHMLFTLLVIRCYCLYANKKPWWVKPTRYFCKRNSDQKSWTQYRKNAAKMKGMKQRYQKALSLFSSTSSEQTATEFSKNSQIISNSIRNPWRILEADSFIKWQKLNQLGDNLDDIKEIKIPLAESVQ